MSLIISAASTPTDYAAFAALVRAYVQWCRERYERDAWFIDRILSHQALERELEDPSVLYGPPNGRAFLARFDRTICGCGAYRMLSTEICEMKRLFVPDRFRGKGIGRGLCEAVIASAAGDGFRLMRLDTATLMTEARAMYELVGFRPCPPYIQYPRELMSHITFMEMPLRRP